MSSILLEVRCRRHPRYTAAQYPRRLKRQAEPSTNWPFRCRTCVDLWCLRRGLHGDIVTVTAGANR